jgi:hypothetical protein
MPVSSSEESAREDCNGDSTPNDTLGKGWSSVKKRHAHKNLD